MGASAGVKASFPAGRAGAAAVALVAAACYLNTLANGFTLDDLEIVVRNPLVTGPEAGDPIRIFSTHYWHHVRDAGNLYRPLTILSYAANHAVFGLAAWSFHAANILLHALASALVAALAGRLGLSRGAALAAGILFAVHPVHTEAVAGVVGRAELMAACGVLGGWALHLGGTGRARAGALALVQAAALFSKENAVVLPALMLAGDAWRMRTGRAPRPGSLAPAYLACLAAAAVWLTLRLAALPDMSDPGLSDSPMAGTSTTVRVLTALHVLARCAGLLIAPVTLSADYSHDQIPLVTSPADPLALAGAAILAALAGGAAGLARGWRGGLLCAALLVSFLPVSNLVVPIGTVMAERLLYLPSAFFCLGVPVAWRLVARGRPRRGTSAPSRLPRAAAVLTLAVALAAAGRTVARNADWRDQLTLFTVTVRTSPRSASARYNLGVALEEAGRPAEALKRYQEAIAIKPRDHRAHHNAGLLLAAGGRPAEAARHLEIALGVDPRMPGTAASLGAVYVALGRDADAERVLRAALAGDPRGEDAHRVPYNLGTLLLRQGRAAEAIPFLQDARGAIPADPDAAYHLGLALAEVGRLAEGRDELRRALALSPGLAEAHLQIALVSLRLGDREGAAASARRALAAGLPLPEELRRILPGPP